MMMDVGLDTGDILETKVIPLDPKETSGSLFEKLSEAGGPLILSTLENWKSELLQELLRRVRHLLCKDAYKDFRRYQLDHVSHSH